VSSVLIAEQSGSISPQGVGARRRRRSKSALEVSATVSIEAELTVIQAEQPVIRCQHPACPSSTPSITVPQPAHPTAG
jgi:hypothetical protein